MLSAILKMPHDGADGMSFKCLRLICSVVGDGVVDVGPVKAADQDQGIPEVQLLHHVFPDLQCTCMNPTGHQKMTDTRQASPSLVTAAKRAIFRCQTLTNTLRPGFSLAYLTQAGLQHSSTAMLQFLALSSMGRLCLSCSDHTTMGDDSDQYCNFGSLLHHNASR